MKKFSVLFDGVVSTTKETIKKISHHKHTLSLVDQPRHDDLYIVSFPKSGATWMDFLMANIHTTMSGDKRSINFFNIHTIIPDIHYCRQVGIANLAFPGFRVIKSHAEFNRYYKNVIYLIRDPRDTMVSYHKFLVGLGQFSFVASITTLSVLARLKRFDTSLEEAAYNLGASGFTVFRTITLPYLRPALIGSAAIAFLMSFENFNTTLMLVGSDAPLTIMMYGRMREGASPVLNAVSLVLMLLTAAMAIGMLGRVGKRREL
jgi:hypothetical protein